MQRYLGGKGFFISTIIILMISLVLCTLTVSGLEKKVQVARTTDLEKQEGYFELLRYIYTDRCESILDDLDYIAGATVFHQFIDEKTDRAKHNLANEWENFVYNKHMYMQVSYLNFESQEGIHVKTQNEKVVVTFDDCLKPEWEDFYERKIKEMNQDEFFMSRMMIYANKAVEKNINKPVIYFIKPVYNDLGEQKGMVILTYYAEIIVDKFEQFRNNTEIELEVLNNEGYWYYHKEKDKRENFSEESSKITFKDSNPLLWKGIMEGGSKGTYYYEGKMYFYYKMFIPEQSRNIIFITRFTENLIQYRRASVEDTAYVLFQERYSIIYIVGGLASLVIISLIFYLYDTIKEKKTLENMSEQYYKVILGIVEFLETGDSFDIRLTNHNFKNIKKLVSLMGAQLKLNQKCIKDIVKYVAIHDIGKIGIDRAILRKPGKLTEIEMNEMKQHVEIGAELIVKTIGDKNKVAENIVRYHHEAWDGTGYCKGLMGKNIPIEARIVALADIYDALRSKRVYKEAMSHEKVMNIICMEIGKKLDPEVVEAFKACEKEIEEIYSKKH